MPTVRRASASEVILLLRDALGVSLSWGVDRIPVVAGAVEVPHLFGDQEVIIRVLGEKADRAQIDSAGRRINRRTRRLEVECRTRLVLDVSHEDRLRLTKDTVGHMTLEDVVADCLECTLSTATDSNGDVLVVGVVRVHDLTDPKPDRDAREWVSSKWSVEFAYDRALTQDRV